MSKLVKAKLKGQDGAESIEFMFNPSEITLSRSMNIEQSPGARTDSGQNKTSFKHPNPYEMKVGNLIFDTYESGKSVLEHLEKLSKAVEFSEQGKAKNKRPPTYIFMWGEHKYLRVFVRNFSCRLSLFLPDGTPVRASVDLTLEQVEAPGKASIQWAKSPSLVERMSSKIPL